MKRTEKEKFYTKEIEDVTAHIDMCGERLKLDGDEIKYTSCPLMRACIATNGPSDGDWGHGGRTYIAIDDLCCFAALAKITTHDGRKLEVGHDDIKSIELLVGGQMETYILRDFFKHAYEKLEAAINDGEDENDER